MAQGLQKSGSQLWFCFKMPHIPSMAFPGAEAFYESIATEGIFHINHTAGRLGSCGRVVFEVAKPFERLTGA